MIAHNYVTCDLPFQYLKWYHGENCIFPIWAILKYKQVVDMIEKKNTIYSF